MDFLELNEPEMEQKTKETEKTLFFHDLFSIINPAEEKIIPPPPPPRESIGLYLDIEPILPGAQKKEEDSENIKSTEKYKTPFTRDEEPEDNSIFNFLELDKSHRIEKKPDKNWVTCPNCGSLNRRGNEFCDGCQMELVTFRQLDLEERKVKVVVKFKKQSKYKICPTCGTPNLKNAEYCSGCMGAL